MTHLELGSGNQSTNATQLWRQALLGVRILATAFAGTLLPDPMQHVCRLHGLKGAV